MCTFKQEKSILFFLELAFKHTMKTTYYFLILLRLLSKLKGWLYLQLLEQIGFLLSSLFYHHCVFYSGYTIP